MQGRIWSHRSGSDAHRFGAVGSICNSAHRISSHFWSRLGAARNSVPYGRNASLHISRGVARSDMEIGGLRNGNRKFVGEIAERFLILCRLRNMIAQLLLFSGFMEFRRLNTPLFGFYWTFWADAAEGTIMGLARKKSRRVLAISGASAVLSFTMSTSVRAAPWYTATPLAPRGASQIDALDLNDRNEIVGVGYTGQGYTPLLWRGGARLFHSQARKSITHTQRKLVTRGRSSERPGTTIILRLDGAALF